VLWISALDAQAYCAWLTTRYPGWVVRLPTEAEWENAACGPSSTTYPWGTAASPEARGLDMERGYTTPVGAYPSGVSSDGCFDMAGNAYEWTSSPIVASNGEEAGQSVNAGARWFVVRGGHERRPAHG
jgi:toxoflavin biosynthesis protein ToxD